jgi:Fe2+ transport system protein FeoA
MTRLTEETAGNVFTVERVTLDDAARVQRLAAFGIFPGTSVRLVAKRPTIVVECGHTSLALDAEVAGDIWVTRAS